MNHACRLGWSAARGACVLAPDGVSHNRFHRYDVDPRGLVLNNNGKPHVAAMESQLAGQVYTNTRLGREASVILNEVVSPNRSVLAGFTEVPGKKADVRQYRFRHQRWRIGVGERPAKVADGNAVALPADAAGKTDATATRPRSDAQATPRQAAGSSSK
jgi:filamentous hemagglutinin family protein